MAHHFFLIGLMLFSAPLAAERLLLLDERPLQLRAEARACYLGFIALYEVDYFAGPDAARCVEVSYLRSFSEGDLDEATRKVFRDRHGDDAVERYRSELERVGSAYRPVAPGDRYTFCVAPGTGGLLLRDDEPVVRLETADFAERFLRIWVRSDPGQGEPEWAFGQC